MALWKHFEVIMEFSYQVLNYVAVNYTNLQTKTIKFRDSMFDTTLAWQIVDSAANRVALLK